MHEVCDVYYAFAGKSSRRLARTEKSADPGVDIIPLSPVWASVTVPDSSGQPSLARILYDLLGKSDFQPLLRSCSFLLIRLHSGSSEYDVTLSGACSLHTSYEYTFVRTAHAILQVCTLFHALLSCHRHPIVCTLNSRSEFESFHFQSASQSVRMRSNSFVQASSALKYAASSTC